MERYTDKYNTDYNQGMQKIFTAIQKLLASALDVLLPRTKEVRFLEEAKALDFVDVAKPARDNLPHITSLFDYRGPIVKAAVWEIKFRGNWKVTDMAGQLLYEHLLEELGERVLFAGGSQTLVVPVPLAEGRLRERGFNQAERLARIMEQLDGGKNFTISNAVVRTRETPSQTKSASRRERLKNLHGAFAIPNAYEVAGKHVIILDDVTTTGTTINEIRTVLLEAGATSATGLTFAH